MRNAMNNKPSFQDSHLLALTAACLAMAAFGCSKTDSLGSVREGGADGVGKDGNGCQSTGANPSKCDAPPAPDASPDTAPDGNACGAGVPVHYSAPGCGADAVPMCGAYSQDACTAVISYCACDGQTTVYGACGTSPSPFLHVGACQSVADAPPDPGCQYPLDSHVDATGNPVRFRHRPARVRDGHPLDRRGSSVRDGQFLAVRDGLYRRSAHGGTSKQGCLPRLLPRQKRRLSQLRSPPDRKS